MSIMQNGNGKFDIILVGLGLVAVKHMKAVLNLPGAVGSLTLVDPNVAAYDKLQRQFGKDFDRMKLPVTYAADLEKALSADNIKQSAQRACLIVALATPSNLHFSQAELALKSGAHCLIEKPITLDLEEAHSLLKLSEEANRKVAVGHIYRYFPLVSRLKKALAQGLIGEITSGSMQVEWGHDQAYYDQADWRGKYACDGGVLLNQTIHGLDFLSYLIDSPIVAADCYLAQLKHEMEAEDYAAAIMKDAKGRPFTLVTTTTSVPALHQATFKLLGKNGDLLLGFKNKRLRFTLHDAHGDSLITLRFILSCLPELFKNSFFATLQRFFNPHQAIYENLFAACQDPAVELLAPLEAGISALEAVFTLYGAAKRTKFTPKEDAVHNAAEMSDFFRK